MAWGQWIQDSVNELLDRLTRIAASLQRLADTADKATWRDE